jgi:response regulator of citrate/malate metabolism
METFSKKVLVVEDDLALQPFWQSVLERCFKKFDLQWAISGEEAKTILQNANEKGKPFDLVVSDIFLAGSDTGIDLMESKELAQSKTNFILVSVADEKRVKDHLHASIQNGAVMSKPLRPSICEKTINTLMHKQTI